MINKVKSLVDAKGIRVYQFRKDTGVAQTTAYELYNNPQHLPSIRVLAYIRQVVSAECRF